MQRARHAELKTTMGYVRTAEVLTGDVGSPFPALPASLLHEPTHRPEGPSEWANQRGSVWKKRGVHSGVRPVLQVERPGKGGPFPALRVRGRRVDGAGPTRPEPVAVGQAMGGYFVTRPIAARTIGSAPSVMATRSSAVVAARSARFHAAA